ncbi:hypothetical protein BC834DRAFT_261936 [Gloeopeniophorella convolvens]|nr:hypothetical protein BC834DRAFT_261936 [Gloeopeniophorella convolvens]
MLTPGCRPKLYFVKADVQACFDTIEQSKLLQILRDVISEDNYVLPRFGQVMQAAGKVKRKFATKALPDGQRPPPLFGCSRHAEGPSWDRAQTSTHISCGTPRSWRRRFGTPSLSTVSCTMRRRRRRCSSSSRSTSRRTSSRLARTTFGRSLEFRRARCCRRCSVRSSMRTSKGRAYISRRTQRACYFGSLTITCSSQRIWQRLGSFFMS